MKKKKLYTSKYSLMCNFKHILSLYVRILLQEIVATVIARASSHIIFFFNQKIYWTWLI